MQAYLTLVRRELGAFFVSIIGYFVIAGVALIIGISFSLLLQSLNGEPFDKPITDVFYGSGLFWLVLLLASPIITMRSFALEKHTGTFECLMTTPVSDFQVVMSKFTGTLIVYTICWAPLLAYPFVLREFSSIPLEIDYGPLASTFLGILMLGCVYMSLGCFASAMTRNQMIAAVNAFAIGCTLFFVSYLARMDLPQTGWEYEAVTYISMFQHMEDFSRGIVDTRHIVYYGTLTCFFLFLTHKVVESRRWK